MNDPVDDVSRTFGTMAAAAFTVNSYIGMFLKLEREGRDALAAAMHELRQNALTDARLANLANEDTRADELHGVKMGQAVNLQNKVLLEAMLDVYDAQERQKIRQSGDDRKAKEHDAVMEVQRARLAGIVDEGEIKREDQRRRSRDSEKRQTRETTLNDKRISEIDNRMNLARQKHELEAKEIGKRIERADRAAGLGEEMSDARMGYDSKMHDTVAFAAGIGSADLGSEAAREWAGRLFADAGIDFDAVLNNMAQHGATLQDEDLASPTARMAAMFAGAVIAAQLAETEHTESQAADAAGAKIEETLDATFGGADLGDSAEPTPDSPEAEPEPSAEQAPDLGL